MYNGHYIYMSMSNQKLISQRFNSIDLFQSQFHWFAMDMPFDAVHQSLTECVGHNRKVSCVIVHGLLLLYFW